LHEREDAFIIPFNPWDAGTARLLAHLGFEALATTSAGYAFSVGQRDNTIGREEMLAHVSGLASAADLPVSADLESGFGDTLDAVAETFRMAAAAGLVGAVVSSVNRPANVVMGLQGVRLSVAELSELGVKRVSGYSKPVYRERRIFVAIKA